MNYKDITIDEILQMLVENERDRQIGVAVTTQLNNPELHPSNQGFLTKNVIREHAFARFCPIFHASK